MTAPLQPMNEYPRELRDPRTLKVHPLIKDQPELGDDSPEFGGMVEGIRSHGFDVPIRITAEGLIADGRHRWRAAKRLRLAQVPVEVVPEQDVAGIALRSIALRRHYTPSQLAYAVVPLLKPAFEAAAQRELAALRKGSQPGRVMPAAKSLDQWAAELGITVRLLQQAREVHDLFTDDQVRTITDRDEITEDGVTFRTFFEPRLMRREDPYGLGAVLTACKQLLDLDRKGLQGRAHTGGRPKGLDKQLELFAEVLETEVTRWAYWRGWDQETRAQHWANVRKQAESLDAERCAELADYHTRLAQEFKRAGKRNHE